MLDNSWIPQEYSHFTATFQQDQVFPCVHLAFPTLSIPPTGVRLDSIAEPPSPKLTKQKQNVSSSSKDTYSHPESQKKQTENRYARLQGSWERFNSSLNSCPVHQHNKNVEKHSLPTSCPHQDMNLCYTGGEEAVRKEDPFIMEKEP